MKGEFDKAIADFTESIRLDPRQAEVYCGRAYAYHQTGEFDKAIVDYDEAVRLDPKQATTYYNRGLAYAKKGDHDKAIVDFTEVILLNPKDAEAYYNRGCTYYKMGDYDKAIADYTEAMRINPNNGYVFYARGCSYLRNDQKAKADADFVQALKLGYKAPGAGFAPRFRPLSILWASPYTLLGLLLGMIGLATGGRVRIRGGIVQFYGGGVKWLLERFPLVGGAMAFTLGHTVFGQTDADLDISHDHEMVHVCQFERWGPLMGPAYLGCSLVLWLTGRRPYRDNPFERQAFKQGGGE
jgi:tetratricopeptide (TPR) repeat protein